MSGKGDSASIVREEGEWVGEWRGSGGGVEGETMCKYSEGRVGELRGRQCASIVREEEEEEGEWVSGGVSGGESVCIVKEVVE